MSARVTAVLVASAFVALAGVAQAATVRLDDSASQVFPPAAQWNWAPGSLRSGSQSLHMNLVVKVRIDTRALAGQSGRVYMVLPVDNEGQVVAEWQAEGRLLGGRLVSGERALIYSGALPAPMLEDTLRVRLTADARTMSDEARRLAFHFEFDSP
ncbi:MAG: hypothetical protein KJ007_19430 [Burkholderiales bacterium]|nr:hypothetical protein [Burkholderiales bacterium]